MKNRIKNFCLLVFTIFIMSNFSEAQEIIVGMDEYIDYANIIRNSAGANNKYTQMKGSPFLTEEFEQGKVSLKNRKVYEGHLRYDIYSDQIEFETKSGDVFEIRNPETVAKVSIGDKKFLCFVKEDGRELDGIYEELVNGEYTLLEKHRIYLKDAVAAKPYVDAKPATFIKKKSEYFIINTEGNVVPISGKKDILSLNADNVGGIKTYIKKNKTKIGDQQDLVDLVNFLNK